MSINKALKILKQNGIEYNDYFDLVGVETSDVFLKVAIERVKTFMTIGK